MLQDTFVNSGCSDRQTYSKKLANIQILNTQV